ncbi:MAG TPA: hypothetical protein VNA04_18605 [Thermoanaerobaculia bacterium]|nr:hypothetical protein [Thermoanaerobaculia bacterium]
MRASCVSEPLVRRAAAEDRWTEALRQHVRECQECAAAAAASPFMARFSRIDARQRALPDPAVLWLKAQLLRSGAAADRAARPLNVAQIVSYAAIAAGWAALLTWKWDELQRWLLSFTPASLVGDLAGTQSAIPATLVLAVVLLSSLTVMLAVHSILAEE